MTIANWVWRAARAGPVAMMPAAMILLVFAASAAAQTGAWPTYPLEGDSLLSGPGARGPGGYLSLTKIVFCLIVFLVWVRTTDWVSRDCQIFGMPYAVWVPVVFFPFMAGLFLFALTIPVFLIGFPLLLVCYGAPLGVYVVKRNAHVEPHERVLTPDHVRFVLSNLGKGFGVKVDAEKKFDYQKGAAVDFTPMGGATDRENNANLLGARQSPGYVSAKELVAEAVARRADKVMLDYGRENVAVRHQIDGVWHNAEPRDRESGDMMLAVFKTLAALDPKERRRRQEGKLGAEFEGKKYICSIAAGGTKTGERAVLRLLGEKVPFASLGELGMREKLQERLSEILARKQGMVLFSAMPEGGLTSTVTLAVKGMDRFMRDFYAVEDAARREPEIENLEVVTYDGPAGQSPADVLPGLIRKEPEVLVVRDLPNVETVNILCREATDGKMVISTIRAKEAVEALVRVLMLKVPPAELAGAVTAVVGGRLIRKLCPSCKEAYAPPPKLLKQLGLPEGRVKALYRPPKPPEDPKQICADCGGIGYQGRTAIFELAVVDDALRQALVKQPKLEVLRQVSRKAGNRSLREEGLLLVVRGVTSLPELMRVLKQ